MMLLFPGQSIQRVGLGLDIYNEFAEARYVWNILNTTIDYDFSNNVFYNSDFLSNSRNTQLAIAAHCLAIFEVVKNHIKYNSAAGNSLGEQICLPVCGCLSYQELFTILNYKGQCMDEIEGQMISVIHCSNIECINDIENLFISNDLFTGCILLSGTHKAIDEAKQKLKARKIIDINVSGPFHSPLMISAEHKFQEFIQNYNIHDAHTPLWSCLSCSPETNGNIIKQHLIHEMSKRIYFSKIIAQNNNFIIIGGEKVMSGIVRGYNFLDISTLDQIYAVLNGQETLYRA